MTLPSPDALARISGLPVLVIGDAMLDRYYFGAASRIAQEAPVPVVAVESLRESPGGAANVAANAAALGANVTFCGLAGADTAGHRLAALLAGHGVRVESVPVAATPVKSRVMAGSQVVVRFDEGRPADQPAEAQALLAGRIRATWDSAALVILSDYGYGTVTPEVLFAIAECQRRAPRPIAVDARDLRRYRSLAPAIVKPDFAQALSLLGGAAHEGMPRRALLATHAQALLRSTGASVACLTMDSDGALVADRFGGRVFTPAEPRAGAAFVNGAGDTYLAAFATAHAAGLSLQCAAEIAATAASIAVAMPGTAVCTAAAIRERLAPRAPTSRVLHETELGAFLARDRAAGRSVVFTNGVFDVLHTGHVEYLRQAASLGDILVVGVNSDASVRRLKGPERPLNTLRDRMAVLAALGCVSYVTSFDDDTPERLIRTVRPDVYVKGGDYHRDQLPETPLVEGLGGRVVVTGYVQGRSTTRLIERARNEAPAPARRIGRHVRTPQALPAPEAGA